MEFKKFRNFYILSLKTGQKINESLKSFCKEKAKNGGFYFGIGALKDPVLAHFDPKTKKYTQKKFKGQFELANISGNICFFKKEIVVHSHCVLGDKNLKGFAGHLVEAQVSGAFEILFFPFPKKIKKEEDKETGLKLLSL